jgi:hypothetical protein
MPREFTELPGWSFDADEVTAGVYRAFRRDRDGRNVEATGLDPDALIEKCRQTAFQIVANAHKANDTSRGGSKGKGKGVGSQY